MSLIIGRSGSCVNCVQDAELGGGCFWRESRDAGVCYKQFNNRRGPGGDLIWDQLGN